MNDTNHRIIVIDDDPGVRDAYREILVQSPVSDLAEKGAALFGDESPGLHPCSPQSYEITLTENGEQGVEAVRRALTKHQQFSVAFIDMNMPGIDGAETARQVWAIDPGIKIVIVTAFSDYRPCDIINIARREDIFYLRKPFNSEEISQFAKVLTNAWTAERERRILAQKLEEMNQNLQQKVTEQAALLIQAEKMSSLGVLAAGVAHEINNPINFLRTNFATLAEYFTDLTQILKDYRSVSNDQVMRNDLSSAFGAIRAKETSLQIDAILDELPSLFDESERGFERIVQIVKSMRNFSHAGHDAECYLFNINKGIEDTLVISQNVYKHHARVKTELKSLPEVCCFPNQLNQVFLNLLVNSVQAIKANNGESKGLITIRTWSEGELICCEIADNGPGIPEEIRSRIFDPFFTTKEPGMGTGLGLSISYDIVVRKHKGSLSVDCPDTGGTVFTLRIPQNLQID